MTTYRYYCKQCNCGRAENGMPECFIQKEEGDEKPEICENSKEGEPVELYQIGLASTFAISKFSGKLTTGQQKKEMLQKRATAHFNKEIKERKNQMWKDTFKPK